MARGPSRDTRSHAGRTSDLLGKQIAGYRVEAEIGRGGMAVVYRAKDLRLDRTVALKLLAPELARNDTFRRRFTHESRVAAAIDHPHIVPVFEAGETDGILYIAMRYVAGSDLRHLLDREGPLPLTTATRIAMQIASALDAAHDHGLVHRDVKPGNILVARGTGSDHPEHVHLTDFGLTKKSLSLTGFTTVGQFVGTLDYVAPEQISGRPVDGRCDVYGFACVVYEILAGRPPFQRDDDMALLWAHQYDEPPPLAEQRPELAAAVDPVFAKALAKSPDDRYDSCLAFVAHSARPRREQRTRATDRRGWPGVCPTPARNGHRSHRAGRVRCSPGTIRIGRGDRPSGPVAQRLIQGVGCPGGQLRGAAEPRGPAPARQSGAHAGPRSRARRTSA